MDITINASKVNVDSNGYKSVSVELEEVEKDQLLDNLTIQDCLDYFEISKILDEIGEDECKEHFYLVENTDEE